MKGGEFITAFLTAMENIDFVNDALSLIQESGGLKFGTDALLLAGYVTGKYKIGAELGAGTGIITMLLLTREKLSSALCLEVQEEYARLTEKNASLNGLTDKITTVCADIREYPAEAVYELVYTNPPYMKTTSGKASTLDKKNIARHEVNGDIADFLESARKLLKYGGAFYAVYRPDRLTDLITAMRNAEIEPKRMTFVHANTEKEPSMVLVEGKRGGKSGMILTPPLIIYKSSENQEYSDDMNYIMENGVFPDRFSR